MTTKKAWQLLELEELVRKWNEIHAFFTQNKHDKGEQNDERWPKPILVSRPKRF
jgi:hypothetical protein